MGQRTASDLILHRRLHIAEFVRIPWPLGGLRAMAEAAERGDKDNAHDSLI
jgi:hypothetical protein